ncbi:CPBP family intramembrane metalloprotease [Pseudolysobacter antarcticus]|uniref:CPBP family intramembrane metalloprotease n=1 Tax=Pseudolysobacter antarcticus TaxID=2511995 RepID=A0A411HFI5_9GAMM|nr:CPBP family intramembrane glutamic endopeptidase [Pseudolysobacter antarcticus]QBB69229.1 CPBP family intramembrane metalloprotease [Pseudolysobacter antarcticus]
MHSESWTALCFPYPLKMSLIMWGPGLAALACFVLFRRTHRRTITFVGGALWRSLAFYFLPMLGLAVIGVPVGEDGQVSHVFVGLLAVLSLFNILGEELGWRGFLQDALRPLARTPRYLLIAVLWIVWHFSNNFADMSQAGFFTRLAWYVPTTIALCVVIGESTDRSRAVLIAVTLHGWMDLCFEFPSTGIYIVTAFALPFWGWLLWTWPQSPVSVDPMPGTDSLVATG